MAARKLQQWLIPFLSRQYPRNPNTEASSSCSSINAILIRYGLSERGVQTHTNPTSYVSEEDSENKEALSVKPSSDLETTINNSAVKFSANSSLKTSSRHDLAMIFTCKVCETRSIKMACHESYEKGVVVARCGGCNNLHLIADRLGWFGKPGSVEDFLAARGEDVKKGSVDTLNLTLEDIAGTKP